MICRYLSQRLRGRSKHKVLRVGEEHAVKPITVKLEKSKETKGTYRFDSPDPNAATMGYLREEERV